MLERLATVPPSDAVNAPSAPAVVAPAPAPLAPPAAPPRRVSWGAVLAGVVTTLATQVLFSILGLGLGSGTIDPLQEQDPTRGIAMGAAIWFVVTSIFALLAGGYVAGRLAGVPRRVDSALHGFLAWGLATLLGVYLLTSAVGGLMSGALGLVGRGVTLAGAGLAAAAPGAMDTARGQLEQAGVKPDFGAFRQEVETLLRQTGKPELQPGAVADQAGGALRDGRATGAQAAAAPQASDDAVKALLDRITSGANTTLDAADRDALVNLVAARTGKSRDEATRVVAGYEQTYRQAQARAQELKVQAEQKAREIGDRAAEGVSKAALWSFAALLVGVASAVLGGYLAGTRRDAHGPMTARVAHA
jgi:hypothetical protein